LNWNRGNKNPAVVLHDKNGRYMEEKMPGADGSSIKKLWKGAEA